MVYRGPVSSSYTEDELWLRLDWALEEALKDPSLSWAMAWSVAMDSADFRDVRVAAERLMDELTPT